MFRILLTFVASLAGIIASLFVSQSDLTYPIVKMCVILIIMALVVGAIAFWPEEKSCASWFAKFKNFKKK